MMTTVFGGINPIVLGVAAGGALGTASLYLSRDLLSVYGGDWFTGNFPYTTLLVNVVGTFVFGVISGWAAQHGGLTDTPWLDFMTVGFLGGFTGFSTFTHETVQLARQESILTAAAYTGFSVALAVMALLTGQAVENELSR
jgi:protein CrcB